MSERYQERGRAIKGNPTASDGPGRQAEVEADVGHPGVVRAVAQLSPVATRTDVRAQPGVAVFRILDERSGGSCGVERA